MGTNNRGRPAGPGERYPCGKLKSGSNKPNIGSISPTAWQRIKTDGIKLAMDERLGTELGRLSLHGELTAAQTAAGFRMAEVYGVFERYHGRRRSAVSPSYATGYGGGQDAVADERMTSEEREAHWLRVKNAEDAFKALQEDLPVYPRGARDLLERLCIDNEAVGSAYLEDARAMLDRLALHFQRSRRAQKLKKPGRVLEFRKPAKSNIDAT